MMSTESISSLKLRNWAMSLTLNYSTPVSYTHLIVPDFKSVGVRDNARCFEYPVIIRAVNTVDAMSATIEQIDWPVLLKITDRIMKEVKNVNRVCYCLLYTSRCV